MATLPTGTAISIAFQARADWVETAADANPLELVPALVRALSFGLADFAAAANAQIVRGQTILQDVEDPDLVAEAIGLGPVGGEIFTRVNTDQLAERLADLEELPLSIEFDWEIPVLQVEAGREIITVAIIAIELREGSLIGEIRGFIKGHPFLAALIALGVPSAGTVHYTDAVGAWQRQQAIERVIGGTACRTESNFRINTSAIRELAGRQLDWERPPEGDSERWVVCRLQYALWLAGEYPGPIDGIQGDKTTAALYRFMEKAGLRNEHPNSDKVRGQLALAASRARIGDPG